MKSVAWMVLVAAVTAAATAEVITRRKTEQRLQVMKHELLGARADVERTEKQRQEERRGRVSAEKELRRVMGEKLDTSNGQYVQSLGHVVSCFRSCLGTPRQGLFAPATRGKIVFCRSISPEMLDGLEQFSHVWVMFVFHKNTNGKNVRAHEGLRSDSHRFTFKAKISPPRLKEKVGIFSTRSPHRPNPIGITLAKIEGVDALKRTVHLSALDLVEGTPVVDIKPYVPAYDSIPTARAAAWISSDLSPTLQDVRWKDLSSLAALEHIAATSSFYRDDTVALRSMIEQVLLADVRSKDQTKRRQRADATWLTLDNARLQYRVVSSSDADASGDWIEILCVEQGDPSVAILP